MSEKSSYAVIAAGGKQYLVQPGDKVQLEKLDTAAEVGQEVSLDKVLLIQVGAAGLQIGTPYVAGAIVKAKVLRNFKEKKVYTFKKRRRKGYRLTKGHRQQKVELLVESMNA